MANIENDHYFINRTRNAVLAGSVRIADGFVSRLRGLLGTDSLPDGEGIYIVPCASIHMFGMKYSIDALFIDTDNKVVGIVNSIPPGQVSPHFKKAHGCLELPSGVLEKTRTELGDQIEFAKGPCPESFE